MQKLPFARRIAGSTYFPEDKPVVKAVVSRGEIRPLEPLPVDRQQGQPLRVQKVDDGETPVEKIDRSKKTGTS
jgi:hypothetical protein